jgi:hypothetical protein
MSPERVKSLPEQGGIYMAARGFWVRTRLIRGLISRGRARPIPQYRPLESQEAFESPSRKGGGIEEHGTRVAV